MSLGAVPDGCVRVASFNIRNGRAFDCIHSWPIRRRRTLEAILDLRADIVGLQEAYHFQLRWLVSRMEGYQPVGEGRKGGRRGEYCPLLVGSTGHLLDFTTRWYGSDTEAGQRPAKLPGARFPRLATMVDIELGGSVVRVANTHLDEGSEENRLTAAGQLGHWLAGDHPTVVTGDLNASPGDPELAPLREAGLRQALPPDAGGTNHDFTGRTDGRRIDHILVSRHWDVVAAGVDATRRGRVLPSDHWPVWADLRLAA